jgi:hypothetical protein
MWVDYNTFMHGVDNADQYLALNPFLRKTKWLKKVFFYLLQCALVNSLQLFAMPNRDVRLKYLNFMKTLPHTLFLESKRKLCIVPPSPASMESASASSVSLLQPPDILQPNKPPQETLHFCQIARENIMFC